MSPNHRGRIQFAVPPDFFVFLQKQTQRAANDCSSAITDATRHNLLVITTFNLQLPKGIPHARLYPLPPDGGSLEKATTYVLVSGHSLFIIWKNCTYLWAVCQRAFYRIKLPCHRINGGGGSSARFAWDYSGDGADGICRRCRQMQNIGRDSAHQMPIRGSGACCNTA